MNGRTSTPIYSMDGTRHFIVDHVIGPAASLGYRSSQVAASEGRIGSEGSGRAHTSRSRKNLLRISRQYQRDNLIYQGVLEQMVTRVIGNGYKLQVRGVSKTQTRLIEKLWRDWFVSPEITGLRNGTEVAQTVMRELAACGDTGVYLTNKSTIQLIEAEQIDGRNEYSDGVKLDDLGRPVAYKICPWRASGTAVNLSAGEPIKPEELLFISSPKRPSDIRGVPLSQGTFTYMDRVADIAESEAIAWQLLSRMGLIINEDEADKKGYLRSKADPAKATTDTEGHLATRITQTDYALIYHAPIGSKITGVERNIPGASFTESLQTYLRLIGLPLGIPLELMLLDWTKSNYSQSRAVLEQVYENFLKWQHKIRDFFYGPLFKWKLAAWQKQKLVVKNDKLVAEWILPTFPWLDQMKEAKAQGEKVERGFTTHAAVVKSLNQDPDEVLAGRKSEIEDAIKTSHEIEKKTGTKVPWQLFAGLTAPKSAPAASGPSADGEGDGDGDDKTELEKQADKEKEDAENEQANND
jgi:capsid protein